MILARRASTPPTHRPPAAARLSSAGRRVAFRDRYHLRMSPPDPRRLAAALVETDAMFGLDAVPLGRLAVEAMDTTTEPEPASTPPRTPPRVTAAAVTPSSVPEAPVVEPGSVLETALPPDAVPGDTPAERLAAIRAHHAAHCPQCAGNDTGRSIVFGEGGAEADLVFVGEAPGEQEDLEGRPFVGPAGELLDKMIAALKLDRSQVWITNVVKTRPPRNRTPRPDEAAACGPWLANELLVVRPKAIVALGGTPAKHLLGTSTGITRLRGAWRSCRIGDLDVPVMPTFHPAFVLRQYTTEVRAAVWQDLQAAHARTLGE